MGLHHDITLAPKKLIRTRRASEGSASEPSLARRVSMCKDAKLSCRGNMAASTTHLDKPGRARMAQGSCPESTRSLPNRHLKVCDVSLLKCPALDFRGRSALEEKFHSLPQVVTRLLDGVALACDV